MTAAAPASAGPDAPQRLGRKGALDFRPRLPGELFGNILGERELGGRLRATRRLISVVLCILLSVPVQAVLMQFPGLTGLGRAKVAFPRQFWRVMCWLVGMRVRVVGQPCPGGQVLFLSNHSSWLDIPVLGSVLPAPFVAKAEVGTWPVVGAISRLGRTIFVSRSRGTTGSFFASGTTNYQWWNADLHAKWLGGSLLTQWTERERSGGSAPPAQASSGRGLLVQAGWALGKVRNVGVVEVMGRWNRLQSLDRAGATPLAALAGSEWGAGANLYLDGHRLKLQADWQHSTPNSGPSAQLARLHLDCTF